jgi:hypothetical protein
MELDAKEVVLTDKYIEWDGARHDSYEELLAKVQSLTRVDQHGTIGSL